MIIEKLIAKNFKKHQAINVDFTPGKNLITGPNYSGKSTILQAILVGLYGNSMAPGETKDLIHDDATDFEVLLYLDNGVCIKRTGKNSSVVGPGGDVVVRTHTAVNKWCEGMLETDRKTFLKVFASEQGSPQALLAMEGSQLRKFIEQAIGMEKLDTFTKKSNAAINTSAAGYNANEELLLDDGDVIDYRKKCEEFATTEQQSTVGLKQAEDSISFLEDRVRGLEADYEKQREAKLTLEKYEHSKGMYDKMLTDLPAPVSIVFTNEMATKLDRDTEVYWDLDDKFKKFTTACQAFDECQEYLHRKSKDLDEALPDEASCEAELKALTEATNLVTSLGAKAKTMEELLEGSSCPTCNRAFDKTVDLAALAEDLVTLRGEVDAAVAVRVDALSTHATAARKKKDYDEAVKNLERARGVIEGLEDQLARAETKKNAADFGTFPATFTSGAMKKSLEEQSQLIQDTDKANGVAAKIEEQRDSLVKLLGELVKPEPMVIDLLSISEDLGRVNGSLTEQRQVHSDHSVCLAEARIRSKNLKKLLEKNAEVKKRMMGFKQQHKDYSAISVALQGARKEAIASAFAQTMGIATEFVKACTGGDISEVYLAENGIRYVENGRGRGTISASGAQKTLIGLGMKLGLSQIVRSPFGALLLDEISSDMDANTSTACLTVLGEYCEQAIIVSHVASDVADNVIQL